MPEDNKILLVNWHSDAWWMRVCDEELTPEEDCKWEEHLATCEDCQQEWEAMQRLNMLMLQKPPVPSLSPDFTANTLQLIIKQQHKRRILSFIAGGAIVIAVSLLILFAFERAIQTFDQYLSVIYSARYVLFSSLMQIVFGVIEEWRMLLPFFIGLTILLFMWLMPNSALVTFAIMWYSRRQRKQFYAVR
jgi:hypothetical protein